MSKWNCGQRQQSGGRHLKVQTCQINVSTAKPESVFADVKIFSVFPWRPPLTTEPYSSTATTCLKAKNQLRVGDV